MTTKTEIETLIRARYPILYLETAEETRTINMLKQVAEDTNKKLFTWSITEGLKDESDSSTIQDTNEPEAVLYKIKELEKKGIVVLKDFHPYIEVPQITRALKDLSVQLKTTGTSIILLSPLIKIPLELQKAVTVLSMPLPETEEINTILNKILESSSKTAKPEIKEKIEATINDMQNGKREAVLKATKGLTLDEAQNVFSKSLISQQNIDISMIVQEKEQIIKKSGILEFFTDTRKMTDIGGLENLKSWIQKRKKAFSEKAKAFGLRTPRGLFLTGSPGTGKSLTAKAVAGYFEMPLLRLDVSKIFSSLVGSSEQNISKALKTAEAVSPCVLWIDEVEKALAGAQASGSLDSGVTARILGELLIWMQEHSAPVFLVVTCNNPLTLPPEFMRRFDEVFFIDLPTDKERTEIIKIHLTKVNRNPENFDIQKHTIATEGYAGAEIENIVMSALYDAFDEGTELTDTHIYTATKRTTPLSERRKTEIEAMRLWGKQNAVDGSKKENKENSEEPKLEFS